ncbi:ATP-dependent RecD-like DNA helicase [Peptococcaceae bacterium CEB3]|nr:ATP-dependent RecD-like DNA helicase [Peptococcaceae bacterium CEB3]
MEGGLSSQVLAENLNEANLPWSDKKKYPDSESHTYQHTVYIGIFYAIESMNTIRKVLSINESFDPEDVFELRSQKTCYGKLIIDNQGKYVEGTLSLSSFPWATGRTSKLFQSNWSTELFDYQQKARELCSHTLSGFCTLEKLRELTKKLGEIAGWLPKEFNFAVVSRGKQIKNAESANVSDETNETEGTLQQILNSFFAVDLEEVLRSADSAALTQYLGDESTRRINLNEDQGELRGSLSADNLPVGRWPFPPHQPLSLMQQVAVNMSLKSKNPLFSVNGPPGTGKTTLLRDIIAAIVTDRAETLCLYKANPEKAFVTSIEILSKKKFKGEAWVLDTPLTGRGMVVASSNNVAVENVSRELPVSDVSHYSCAEYFKQIAQSIYNENAWGLLSADLGKSKKNGDFAREFWFHPQKTTTMKKYLENVDIKSQRKREWEEAVERFQECRRNVDKLLTLAKEAESALDGKLASQLEKANEQMEGVSSNFSECQKLLEDTQREYSQIKEKKGDVLENRKAVQSLQPRFLVEKWIMMFKNPKKLKDIEDKILRYTSELDDLDIALSNKEEQRRNLEAECKEKADELKRLEGERVALSNELTKFEESFEKAKRRFGDFFPDEIFWADNKLQTVSPWASSELNNARSQLFLAALHVHEAFVKFHSEKFQKCLSSFMDLIQGNLDEYGNETVMQSLWEDFFMVVPVVSTTLASFRKLFKGMGRESLGYLFIDEAGQAQPQAAVGAVWRSKTVIVVGDPMQIEPIFTVPEVIVDRITKHLDISEKWNPQCQSVQTLADRANSKGAMINGRWVGCPLRVHRRCHNPMFEIANEMAYDNLMIFATGSGLRTDLPESCWYDIRGNHLGDQKWISEQCLFVVQLFRQLKKMFTEQFPPVCVISPFRDVARRIKGLLRTEILKWDAKPEKDVLEKWLKDSVGTVHTFQGKENEIVIMLLGVDGTQMGSAIWAAETPNILNVALTRAKQRVYIVGDESVWGHCNHFGVAAEKLPGKYEI